MPIHVKDGGVWRTVDDPQVRVSGVWRPVQEGWVRVSGVWRQIFSRIAVNLNFLKGASFSAFQITSAGNPVTVSAGVKFQSDGTLQDRNPTSPYAFADSAAGQWASTEPDAGIGSDYQVRLTVNSGDNPTSGPAVSTWHTISSDRQWDLSVTGTVASKSGSWTVAIRDVATNTVQDSATFSVSVFVDVIN